MSHAIQGMLSPLVTPFTSKYELDEASLRRETKYMLGKGVDGIVVGGSTGDGHTLSVQELARCCEIVAEEVPEGTPVIAGVIQNTTASVIQYARACKAAGANALQVTPVHYLFRSSDDSTLRFFETIGSETQLPIIIYNVIPWNPIDPAALLSLDKSDWVVGVKQSGGDAHKLADLLRAVRAEGRELRVFSALDDLLYPSFALGAHGAISASLAAAPEIAIATWRAVAANDHAEALRLHESFLPLWRVLDHPDLPARMRTALRLQGRPVGEARLPIEPVAPSVAEEIRNGLVIAGLEVAEV